MKHNKQYPYIVAWEKYKGALPFYIELQVQLAQQENAPERAIFWHSGRWVTVDELPNPEIIEMFEERVEAERVA